MKMTPFGALISAEEARRRLLAAATPVRRTEKIALLRAVGRVSAEEVRAPRPIPSFWRASWDGYAMRASDTRAASRRAPRWLKLVGELHAEESLGRPLAPGECVAVATGAPLPRGTDCVEIFERVKVKDGQVGLTAPVPRWNCLAEPGEDMAKGERLVSSGQELTPALLGALGATGRDEVRVFERPVVVLVPNGNELVPPGQPLPPGRIYEFNNVTLSALVEACGGLALALPPVPDDPWALQGTLEGALRSADLVISAGGSSVGERDYLPTVFPKVGRLLFHGIKVRPGKPTLAAQAGSKLLLGMPGHPASCLSNGLWLLLPLLRKFGHLPGPGWIEVPAVWGEDLDSPADDFARVVPVRLQGGRTFSTYHRSSSITSFTRTEGFVMLAPGKTRPRKGSPANVRRLLPPLGRPWT